MKTKLWISEIILESGSILKKLQQNKAVGDLVNTENFVSKLTELKKLLPDYTAINKRKELEAELQDFVFTCQNISRLLSATYKTKKWMCDSRKNIDLFYPEFFRQLKLVLKNQPKFENYIKSETWKNLAYFEWVFLKWKINRKKELVKKSIKREDEVEIRSFYKLLCEVEIYLFKRKLSWF